MGRALALCAGVAALLVCGCLVGAPALLDSNPALSMSAAPRRIAPMMVEDVSATVVQLTWSAVPGATSYTVHFGVDTNPPEIAATTATSYVVRELPACTTHYWRVVATSGDEFVSSVTWTFKTRCPE